MREASEEELNPQGHCCCGGHGEGECKCGEEGHECECGSEGKKENCDGQGGCGCPNHDKHHGNA